MKNLKDLGFKANSTDDIFSTDELDKLDMGYGEFTFRKFGNSIELWFGDSPTGVIVKDESHLKQIYESLTGVKLHE